MENYLDFIPEGIMLDTANPYTYVAGDAYGNARKRLEVLNKI